MKTLDSYISESILSSVNAGKEYYKNLVISELDRWLSKIRTGYIIHAEQLPGHSKPTIIISGLVFQVSKIEFEGVSQKMLDGLKCFDGIMEELGGYCVPRELTFSELNNAKIDLSSFDYTDSKYQCSEYSTIKICDCVNTEIVQLPKYSASCKPVVIINGSTVSRICKLPKTTTLQIQCSLCNLYKIDLSPFYNLGIKSFRLDSDYFRNNQTPDYNNTTLYCKKGIIGDALRGYDESVKHILDMNIAEDVYIDFYGLNNRRSTYLIKTTHKGDFSIIKKRTTYDFML